MNPSNATDAVDVERLAAEITGRIDAMTDRSAVPLRSLRREYSLRIRGAAPRGVVALGLRLMEHPGFEGRFLAYELIAHHREAMAVLSMRDVERLGRGLDSWWTVDTFACYVAGPAWREGRITDAVIARWSRSRDRWWRRAALVATVPLNNKARGGHGDTERTFAVCESLLDDRDDMVVKAMSWALRAAAVRDPAQVTAFIERHRDRLAARVLREVGNKLRTGRKSGELRVSSYE